MLDERSMPSPAQPNHADPYWDFDGVCGTIIFPDGSRVVFQGDEANEMDALVDNAAERSMLLHMLWAWAELAQ